jgi:hypothetical protein
LSKKLIDVEFAGQDNDNREKRIETSKFWLLVELFFYEPSYRPGYSIWEVNVPTLTSLPPRALNFVPTLSEAYHDVVFLTLNLDFHSLCS